MTTSDDLADKIGQLSDGTVADLMDFIKIRSVYDEKDLQPVKDAANWCQKKLTDAGVKPEHVEQKCIGDPAKNAPLVYATCGPDDVPIGTPTVLLYAHYDVVEDGGWEEAWNPKLVDDKKRVQGRGAADDKSGVMMHLGALRALKGKPPVSLKIVLEGEEESGDTLEGYVRKNKDLFKADVIIIADTGNYKLGEPTFTTSLRGVVAVDVTLSTLKKPKHSGVYGGPPPDAFMALTRILTALLDDKGDVAIPDLVRDHWSGKEPDETAFRTEVGILPQVNLIGSDTLGSRLYVRPAVNVTGLSGPQPYSKPVNQLTDTARARVSLRIAPSQNPEDAIAKLERFIEQPELNPWNAEVTVEKADSGAGFQADTTQPGYTVAKKAMKKAYPGKETVYIGDGGAIPLVTELQQINPKATVLLIGCEEPLCNIHSSPESVDIDELAAMTLAECSLLRLLAPKQ
ncbi:M20/M25/M40 family metallo-hydrolase [Streptomyces zagrosensis]|uniref:Acetylornithine deacetylase/succinyl-diaminopimelate desuccinylase-like protein n=1 Tax=Streptomyces zagrosensis TaxID=1042984 RepID=A0A7W9V278_9ACTN|nr:M20/M25/M40 family metallo-hydrolase [Streptomyces zagrosensis]MBB5939016.1 acetylornithine deacetylase/succinyl-diaminopimelate desuccinylase-like protein [Streptomyces zagrosensis]